MNIILLFIILSIVNVVLSTIRSLVTIKCGKTVASIINATYYGFYTIVVIYTVADFDLWIKVAITFFCNLIGVFIVKLFEERMRKEKLWKVEATISKEQFELNKEIFEMFTVPHNYINIGDNYIMNFYCANCKQSEAVKVFLEDCKAKYFVSESKAL